MREMTKAELESWYKDRRWPCGHGSEYLRGPAGGLMVNVKCPTCNMRLNVVNPDTGFNWPTGQVLFEPEGYSLPKRKWWRRLAATFRKEQV